MLKPQVLIVLSALAICACSKEPRRIGVWMGPTGANIAKMAQTEVNFNGGVAGRRLMTRVVAQRTVSFNELTHDALKISLDSMVQDTSVLAVITRMTDTITEAAAQLYESMKMPYLVATPVSREYTKTHPHAFLLVPTVEEQAEFLAEQAMAEPQPRRVVIINVREEHADSMASAVTRALKVRGMTPVFSTSFSQTADEFNLQAKSAEVTTYKPTIIYFIGRSPSLFLMHGFLRNKLPDMRLLGSDLVESFHVYANPGWKYTGLRFVRYFDPLSTTDTTISVLRDRLWGWVGRNELNSEAALTYDGVKTLAEAMKSGAVTREALVRALSSSEWKGVIGPVKFGPERMVKRTMYLAEVRSDTVVTVASSDKAALAKK